jgi:competence protein ComEA
MKEKTSDQELTVSVIPEAGIENCPPATAAAIEEEIMIIVDVSGAVQNPSVVELPEGSRIFEAIKKAGGLAKDADLGSTNQAEILTDGQKIYIPTKQELKESLSGTPSSQLAYAAGSSQPKLININTADSAALQQLTGVGPVTAEKIINYRNENGKFKTIEDIKNVSGIGDKTFEKFKGKITV